MEDARQLIELTGALTNSRKRRMRREKREALGGALDLPKRRWNQLDCVESGELFVVLKPNGKLDRSRFQEDALRPLLRQAVVAIAAAVETYVADRSCGLVSAALDRDEVPKRLREMAINVGDVSDIERTYQRRKWGYRMLIQEALREQASAAPSRIGVVFSTVGVSNLWKDVDACRKVKKGTSEAKLLSLADRRNDIAHSADWSGRGRATLTSGEVETFFTDSREIIEAIDAVVSTFR